MRRSPWGANALCALKTILETEFGEPHVSACQVKTVFNYDIVAELSPIRSDPESFPGKSRRQRRQPVGYGRFARAVYAIRFAIEELPADLLSDSCLEVDEQIFDGDGIRRLYDSEDYPLVRRTAPVERMSFRREQ